MKEKILEIQKIIKDSKKNEDLISDTKTKLIELINLNTSLVKRKRSDILDLINNLENSNNLDKSKKIISKFGNQFLQAISFERKNKEEEIVLKPLLFVNTNDKDLDKKMNEVLKIFHEITKTHNNQINKNGQNPLDIRNLSNKEIAILKLLKNSLNEENFNKLNIKWNPMIGLLIESKEGFESPNQVIMMSHLDLVTPFADAHKKVEDGELLSALNFLDNGKTLDKSTIIAGSLDNTMTNAILLNNYLKGNFNSNINMLFETDEESGMSGTRFFYREEQKDLWTKINISNNKITLSKVEHPKIQNDLVVMNLDVTMGYDTPCAIETRDFKRESKENLLNKFKNLSHKEYGYDDSTSTVTNNLVAFSYCINVGTNYKKLEDGKMCFQGGCHSMNTYSNIENVLTYNELMPNIANSLNKDIKLELEVKVQNVKHSNYEDNLSYEEIMLDLQKDFILEEVLNSNNILNINIDNNKDKLFNELSKFTKNMVKEDFNKLKDLREVRKYFMDKIDEKELIKTMDYSNEEYMDFHR